MNLSIRIHKKNIFRQRFIRTRVPAESNPLVLANTTLSANSWDKRLVESVELLSTTIISLVIREKIHAIP